MTRAIAPAANAAEPEAEHQSPYERWVRSEGLEVVGASEPLDLRTVPLKRWARRGGRGAFVRHADISVAADCYVCEIPPGQRLEPQRHLFEEIVYVLAGRGSTSFSDARGGSHSFEWQAGTLFALPLNARHQHFNGSGKQAVRFVGVTTAPAIMNAFRDPGFVFDCGHDFGLYPAVSREIGGPRAIGPAGACGLDALDCPLVEIEKWGAGGHLVSSLGTGSLSGWISQLPPATYSKAHAFGLDAYTIVLAGEGRSLVWEAGSERTGWRWQEGSLLTAANGWWRQHFNPCRSPARFVTLVPQIALQFRTEAVAKAGIRHAVAGACIDYTDEDEDIRAWFARALAEHGLESRMSEAYATDERGE